MSAHLFSGSAFRLIDQTLTNILRSNSSLPHKNKLLSFLRLDTRSGDSTQHFSNAFKSRKLGGFGTSLLTGFELKQKRSEEFAPSPRQKNNENELDATTYSINNRIYFSNVYYRTLMERIVSVWAESKKNFFLTKNRAIAYRSVVRIFQFLKVLFKSSVDVGVSA